MVTTYVVNIIMLKGMTDLQRQGNASFICGSSVPKGTVCVQLLMVMRLLIGPPLATFKKHNGENADENTDAPPPHSGL